MKRLAPQGIQENARASCVASQQILVFEGEARDRVSRIWAGAWQGRPADFLVALTFLLLFVLRQKVGHRGSG